MVWAGTDLWRLSNQISISKQGHSKGRSGCSGLWAEHGKSTNSLVLCFSGYYLPQRRFISLCPCGLCPSSCPCDSTRGTWLLFYKILSGSSRQQQVPPEASHCQPEHPPCCHPLLTQPELQPQPDVLQLGPFQDVSKRGTSCMCHTQSGKWGLLLQLK